MPNAPAFFNSSGGSFKNGSDFMSAGSSGKEDKRSPGTRREERRRKR